MPRFASALVRSAVLGLTPMVAVTVGWAESDARLAERIVLSQAAMPAAPIAPIETIEVAVPGAAKREETIDLKIGRSEILATGRRVAAAIVGNENIADVEATPTGVMILRAKGLGTTNIILLDDDDQPILDATVKVSPLEDPPDVLEVHLLRRTEDNVYTCEGFQLCDKGEGGAALTSTPVVTAGAADAESEEPE